jgi:hypothetical protein
MRCTQLAAGHDQIGDAFKQPLAQFPLLVASGRVNCNQSANHTSLGAHRTCMRHERAFLLTLALRVLAALVGAQSTCLNALVSHFSVRARLPLSPWLAAWSGLPCSTTWNATSQIATCLLNIGYPGWDMMRARGSASIGLNPDTKANEQPTQKKNGLHPRDPRR